MHPDPRLRRVHYDWLEAGEHTQRTVALLSEQLRRFLDDKAWLENRRIMDILHGIETHALALREKLPDKDFMDLVLPAASIELPLERPLHRPASRPLITQVALDKGDAAIDTAILYSQIVVDKAELARNIRQELQELDQISLGEVISRHPLQHGLAELVTYVQLAGEWGHAVVDEKHEELVRWETEAGLIRQATLPHIILMRNG
jgi:hypothetical protein